MIPSYTRMGNSQAGGGSSTASASFLRRSFRAREKCLILLVFLTLGFICFGGFFYLPDNFGSDRVLKVYKQFQNAGPEIFIPAPPVMIAHGGPIAHPHSGPIDHKSGEVHPRRAVDDWARLNAKIEKELGADILEKPDTSADFKDEDGGVGVGAAPGGEPDEPPLMNPPSPEQAPVGKAPPNASPVPPQLQFVNGEDSDPIARQHRNKVKEVNVLKIFLSLFD